MTEAQARDELFCKLAIRQGLLTKQSAQDALRLYRSEGKVSQGIGDFLVRNGQLEAGAAEALEGAIARRASGHVADSRKRVPKTHGSHGGPVHHRRHVPARPAKVAASPVQLTVVGIAFVVLIVAVLAIVFEMNKNSASPADEIGGSEPKPTTQKTKTESGELHPALVGTAPPPKPEFTEADLENYRATADRAVTSARQAQGDGSLHVALLQLTRAREELAANYVPESIISVIDAETKELQEIQNATYEEQLAVLKKNRSEGKEQAVAEILADIEKACGPDMRKKAAQEIE